MKIQKARDQAFQEFMRHDQVASHIAFYIDY
jgi:hypothetical protein